MSSYQLFEIRQFQKDLERLSRSGERAIVAKLEAVVYPELRQHPHFGPHIRKLRGISPETWRYRIGAWRFFYEVDDDEGIEPLRLDHFDGKSHSCRASRGV